MKTKFSPAFSRAIALGAIALGFSISTASAQTMLTVDNESQSTPVAKKVSLLVELELPSEGVANAADSKSADKYRLHVSDRAHRGQIDAAELRGESVLPELPEEVPATSRQKFVAAPQEPRSGE